MAEAVLRMMPEAKIAIGPPIDNGFYYDFDLPRTLSTEDLESIEEAMRAGPLNLVIWQAGTTEALRSLPIDDMAETIREGLDRLHARGIGQNPRHQRIWHGHRAACALQKLVKIIAHHQASSYPSSARLGASAVFSARLPRAIKLSTASTPKSMIMAMSGLGNPSI
jgi:hypothetical protein